MENINNIVNEMEVNPGNFEVMEVTEIATSRDGKGFKIAAGIGLAVLGSVFAYKYVVKPIITKIKDKKAQQEIDGETIDLKEDEIEEIE